MVHIRGNPWWLRSPGSIGPKKTYEMNTMAMIGKALPMLRRAASSRSSVPMQPAAISYVVRGVT
jgi:hypothetical protein